MGPLVAISMNKPAVQEVLFVTEGHVNENRVGCLVLIVSRPVENYSSSDKKEQEGFPAKKETEVRVVGSKDLVCVQKVERFS